MSSTRRSLPLNGRLLDIATGTGDIALEGLEQTPGLQAVGGDFTMEMMQAGKRIPARRSHSLGRRGYPASALS